MDNWTFSIFSLEDELEQAPIQNNKTLSGTPLFVTA